jgi:hypothetical protein
LATVKENIFRVYPLRRVEPILFEEEGHTRKTRVPILFVSVARKTRTHANRIIFIDREEKRHWTHAYTTNILSSFPNSFFCIHPQSYTWPDGLVQFEYERNKCIGYYFGNWWMFPMPINKPEIWLLNLYLQLITSIDSLVYIKQIFIEIYLEMSKSNQNAGRGSMILGGGNFKRPQSEWKLLIHFY